MGEGTELLVSVEGMCGAIPKELRLDGELDHTRGGTTLGDGVGEVVGEGAQ